MSANLLILDRATVKSAVASTPIGRSVYATRG
jgi:hypothetical protein